MYVQLVLLTKGGLALHVLTVSLIPAGCNCFPHSLLFECVYFVFILLFSLKRKHAGGLFFMSAQCGSALIVVQM